MNFPNAAVVIMVRQVERSGSQGWITGKEARSSRSAGPFRFERSHVDCKLVGCTPYASVLARYRDLIALPKTASRIMEGLERFTERGRPVAGNAAAGPNPAA